MSSRTLLPLLALATLASCETYTETEPVEPPAEPAGSRGTKADHDCGCDHGSDPGARQGLPPDQGRYAVPVDGRPSDGPDTAAVTLVVFSDFECPYCRRVPKTLRRLRAKYPDDLRVVFRQRPLPFHRHARRAALAALAAHGQGEFWTMHDLLFTRQAELAGADLSRWAAELGLDPQRFERDLADERIAKLVDEDLELAQRLGARGTPSFFINGRFVVGAQPFGRLDAIVGEQLREARQFVADHPEVPAHRLYEAMNRDE